ncbi:MAG TPA: PadR family transcriptional regulator [Gemmatimonadales bacterium]|nr:PadR family transcriptional regulator [Gemmatimonadales bacterium]
MSFMPSYLGEFEQLVLLTLLRLGGEGYGVMVREQLGQKAGRSVSLGTVYKTLLRLESKGLVAVHLGEPTPERGGRRKKHYSVTGAGRRSLQRSLEALRKLSHGLDASWDLT